MAASSTSTTVGKAEHLQDGKQQWLEEFIERPYFKACLLHDKSGPAGLSINKFCVDCKTPVCPRCIVEFGHTNHAIIQVFRHVYQDAASVEAIKSFMNINDIQTYKSNQALVVALRPLLSISKINNAGPNGELACYPRSSGRTNAIIRKFTPSAYKKKNNQIERKCQVCAKRLLPMHECLYCSIQCKLTDYMNKSDHSMPPFLMPGTESLTEGHNVKIDRNDNNVKFEKNENNENLEDAKKIDGPTPQRRKRKGIPHRAPFF